MAAFPEKAARKKLFFVVSLAAGLSEFTGSIPWYPFSPWQNSSELGFAHDLSKALLYVVLVVLVVFPTSARNVPIFPLRMKARTRLARIERMMRHDDRPWIPPLELPHQRDQRTLLRLRPRVRRPALGVEATLVAHPDAMPVVVQAVRSHLRLGSSPLDGSVPSHHIVVADTTPAPLAVPRVNLLRARRLAGPYRRAMNNDQSDSSHRNSSERSRPLHLPSTS